MINIGKAIKASMACFTLLKNQVFFWEHNFIIGIPQKLSIYNFISMIFSNFGGNHAVRPVVVQ